MAQPMPAKHENFVNSNTMVTDMLRMDDDLSAKLLEYFEKNFDVDFKKLKKEEQ